MLPNKQPPAVPLERLPGLLELVLALLRMLHRPRQVRLLHHHQVLVHLLRQDRRRELAVTTLYVVI
jgi:hypothetical protein